MVVVRAAKTLSVAGMALLLSLVAFGNVTDFGTNLAFVGSTCWTMDTIFPGATIRYRAIDKPAAAPCGVRDHHRPRKLVSAALCWIGAWQLSGGSATAAGRSIAPRAPPLPG